jgi:membrane protease YdiL (CAAX protease family)
VAAAPQASTSRWKWRDLGLLYVGAWIVPGVYTAFIEDDLSGTQLLDASLAVQIAGYLLAAALVAFLVRRRHHGDWGSLGIDRSADTFHDLTRGAGFGLVLISAWFLVSLPINRGSLKFEAMVRSLIGDTSQLGLLLAALVLVVGAPVIEEIYYRGMLFSKFSRWGHRFAIVGTSLLFVMAHGALIIPALLILAFGLALRRRKRGLWFTMGAHGAWNGVILALAAWMMLGPAQEFSPEDGAYRLRHSREWQRMPEAETSGEAMRVDLALESTTGSYIAVGRFDLPTTDPGQLPGLLDGMGLSPPEAKIVEAPKRSAHWFEGTLPTYEGIYSVTVDKKECLEMASPKTCNVATNLMLRSRIVTALPASSNRAVFFQVVCAETVCDDAGEEFDDLIRSTKLE